MIKIKASLWQRLWKEWRGFIIFIFLMVVFRSGVADWYSVPTGSMKPTIVEGDRIFVNKLAYDLKIPFTLIPIATWDAPRRGDIVVFDSPAENKRLVKRVVGLPGDVIEINNNRLLVNGNEARYLPADQSLVHKYWDTQQIIPLLIEETIVERSHLVTVMPYRFSPGRNFGPVEVPADHYFMLGDNRDNSADSRFIGAVHERYILGKANTVVLSFNRMDRFFVKLD